MLGQSTIKEDSLREYERRVEECGKSELLMVDEKRGSSLAVRRYAENVVPVGECSAEENIFVSTRDNGSAENRPKRQRNGSSSVRVLYIASFCYKVNKRIYRICYASGTKRVRVLSEPAHHANRFDGGTAGMLSSSTRGLMNFDTLYHPIGKTGFPFSNMSNPTQVAPRAPSQFERVTPSRQR